MAKASYTVKNRELFDAMRNVGVGINAAIDCLIELRDQPFHDKAAMTAEEKQIRADGMIGHMAGYCEGHAHLHGVTVPRGVNDVAGFWEKYATEQFNKSGNARSNLGFFAEKAARQQWSTLLRAAHLEPVNKNGGARAGAGRKRKEESKGKAAKPEPRVINVSEETVQAIPTWQTVATAKDWLAGQFALIEKAAARNPDVANDKAIAELFAKIHKMAQSL